MNHSAILVVIRLSAVLCLASLATVAVEASAQPVASRLKEQVERTTNAATVLTDLCFHGFQSERAAVAVDPKDEAEVVSSKTRRRDALDKTQQLCTEHFGPNPTKSDLRPLAKRAAAAIVLTVAEGDQELVDLQTSMVAISRSLKPVEARSMTPSLERLGSVAAPFDENALPIVGIDAAGMATTLLAGLASLIQERARFEAIGWFLTELGDRVCRHGATTNEDTQVALEMRAHFMPSLCALAAKKQLWEYGAGTALWRSLQVSARADIRNLPGALAGMATLALTDDKLGHLGCHPGEGASASNGATPAVTATAESCRTANTLRTDTAARVASLLDGEEATVVLGQWSENLTKASTLTKEVGIKDPIDVLACATSLPAFIRKHRKDFADAGLPNWQAALTLSALAGTPACRALVLPVTPALTDILKMATDHLEKARKLVDAIDAWIVAKARLDEVLKPTAAPPASSKTELTVSAESEPAAVKAAVAALSTNASDASAKAEAVFALVQASLRIVDGSLGLLGEINPGFDATARAVLRDNLDRVTRAFVIAKAAFKGDWSLVLNEALTLGAAWTEEPNVAKNVHIKHLLARAKDLAVLVSIASAGDADEMARTLDALADPPGGWRTKREQGTFTVSLTSHAGFLGGFEGRWGPYGAVYETGDVYAQPPSLALPTGLELAWGVKPGGCPLPFSVNFMVWVLDPAAFLQYDAANEGRLPGPSPVTALSPGLELGVSIADTPFNVGVFGAFRPGYRQWEADASAGGAHVVQGGLIASVDVTLFSFMSKRGGSE